MRKTPVVVTHGKKLFLFFCRIVVVTSFITIMCVNPANASDTSKIYWHFIFKAFVHMPDRSAVEWAWVTMVEMPSFTLEEDGLYRLMVMREGRRYNSRPEKVTITVKKPYIPIRARLEV